jgi:hypothetical protein
MAFFNPIRLIQGTLPRLPLKEFVKDTSLLRNCQGGFRVEEPRNISCLLEYKPFVTVLQALLLKSLAYDSTLILSIRIESYWIGLYICAGSLMDGLHYDRRRDDVALTVF